MKNTIKSILVLLSLAASTQAATIVVQTGSPAVEFKVAGGGRVPLAGGGVVLGFIRGYSAGTAAAITTALGDSTRGILSYISTNFVPIGSPTANAAYGTSAVATPWGLKDTGTATTASGTIENSNWLSSSASVVANSEQAGGLVRGTKVFLLAYTGNSLAEATELGIYSATTWTLPASASLNTLSMTLTQVDTAAEVFRGSLGSLVLAPVPPIVPEPSVGIMTLLAGLGLISRRRRA